jgi:hypothetical protein
MDDHCVAVAGAVADCPLRVLVALFAGLVAVSISACLLHVAGTSLWLSPQSIVPAAMLEVVASISLLRSVWSHVSWRYLAADRGLRDFGTLGVWCLSILPELPLRLAVSTIILVMALALRPASVRAGAMASAFDWGTGRGRVRVRPVFDRGDGRHDAVRDVVAGGGCGRR